jgi:hypothetical protein
LNAPLVETMEIGIGGELGVEDQLLGPFSGTLLSELGET